MPIQDFVQQYIQSCQDPSSPFRFFMDPSQSYVYIVENTVLPLTIPPNIQLNGRQLVSRRSHRPKSSLSSRAGATLHMISGCIWVESFFFLFRITIFLWPSHDRSGEEVPKTYRWRHSQDAEKDPAVVAETKGDKSTTGRAVGTGETSLQLLIMFIQSTVFVIWLYFYYKYIYSLLIFFYLNP
jgi:hypothetical protein